MTTRPGSVHRIPRRTLATAVTEQIRERIFDGTFEPGLQLNEVDLAGRFATSRGPIREGLQRLVQEGLLRSEPHRGVFVPVMTSSDLQDIYFARAAVEGAAIRAIAEREAPAALLVALDRTVGEMTRAERKKDWGLVARLDLRFHQQVVEAAGSARLNRMFSTLMAETQLCLGMLVGNYAARADLVAEHGQLAQLLAAGRLEPLMAAFEKHLADAVTTLRRHDAVDAVVDAVPDSVAGKARRQR